MSTLSAPALSVRNLTVSFGHNTVVRNLSFDLVPGKTLAVVGESGSGKSVTSLAMMGLLPDRGVETKGEILFEGRDLLKATEAELQSIRGGRLSMIFQEPMTSLNPVQRVGDQIAEAISYHRGLKGKALDDAVLALFERVRIPDPARRMRQYPHTFSGGMRQRVMIAMALACDPVVLIADEPTTALDVTIQAEIIALLRDLQKETGVAILFITHDMGVVAEIADDVMVMRRGDLIEHGPVGEIFDKPEAPYTASLIAAVPRLSVEAALPVPQDMGKPVLEVLNMRVRFPVRGGLLSRVTGHVHAVEDVSFAIGPGETLGLVGESGSGKSTIGRAIINLNAMQSGDVLLDGHAVDYDSADGLKRLRRAVQMIFQDPFGSLDPRQSVGSTVIEPMIVHKLATPSEAVDRMEALLERVGLNPLHASRLPHEFSGGQRQRICIARALAMSPRVIIADEAVSALDVTIKAQIIELMQDLQEELGLAYLFISHDMAAVEKICSSVAVMHFGELVEIGPVAQVIGEPGHDYTRNLLSAVPITHPSLRGQRQRSAGPVVASKGSFRPVEFQAPAARWQDLGQGHRIRLAEGAGAMAAAK